jgi:outer membrane protein OmpA-like peptidoglycan-associated protein
MRHAAHVAFIVLAPALISGVIGTPSPAAAQIRGAQSPAPNVPLVVDLVTVSAVHEPDKGDYESILKVAEVTDAGIRYTVSGNIDDRRVSVRRKVTRQDWAHAHEWHPRYNEGDPEVYPGTTGGTLSSDVLTDLKTKGQTTLKASVADDPIGGMLAGLLGDHAGATGTLARVEPQPVAVSMLVNDVRVDLPAVHARGKMGDEAFEAFILDDPAIPLVLRWKLGDTNKRMIRISYPVAHASSPIEEKLSTTGRAEVYGIYFDFGKATIRPESEPVLKDIGDVMAKNPAWQLGVEGHTDNIGGAAANQDLSTRRAAAVRQALVDRYRVAATRLTPAGFGASRPKETNDTLEGRARNRRVELVRQPGR